MTPSSQNPLQNPQLSNAQIFGHFLVIQEEKYSQLRLRIKATSHSGAFFKTLNYSFLEERP